LDVAGQIEEGSLDTGADRQAHRTRLDHPEPVKPGEALAELPRLAVNAYGLVELLQIVQHPPVPPVRDVAQEVEAVAALSAQPQVGHRPDRRMDWEGRRHRPDPWCPAMCPPPSQPPGPRPNRSWDLRLQVLANRYIHP